MRVVNCSTDILTDESVYIGRPSKWGNPFVVGKDGTRCQVIEKYKTYLYSSAELMGSLHELSGKDLACWCKPKPCHGDVILRAVQECMREDIIVR